MAANEPRAVLGKNPAGILRKDAINQQMDLMRVLELNIGWSNRPEREIISY